VTDEGFAQWVSERADIVEARLRTAVETSYALVSEAAQYLIDAGGKRFRPTLTIAAGGFGLDAALDEEGLLSAAVVVELTHVASLYHDDVMDEAELRRDIPTAHRRWGNSVAILVGDYMLAQASLVGAALGEDFMTYQARTLSRLVQGQIAEISGPAAGADPLEHYLSVVADKTAALIAASARYGAIFAGLPADQVESLTEYGEQLGLAFQVADDLLDILGEQSGKQPGTDLREGVATLVPLLVQSQARPRDARLLELLAAPVPDADIPEALTLLRAHPAVGEARAQIRHWANQAATNLAGFPDTAPTRALKRLCDQAVLRTR